MSRRILLLSSLLAALAASAASAQPPAGGLRVGVRRLPEKLSPALATTDNELRAVELLFEGLVKVSEGPDGVSVFRPALADGPPRQVPKDKDLGRLFRLRPDARWSDGKPLTDGDVQNSVAALKDRGGRVGRSPAYGELLKPVLRGGDEHEVALRLNQGYFEPLALMTFKVLPASKVLPAASEKEEEDFAGNPVGSGPFRKASADKNAVVFAANEHYKGPRPPFAEVRFIRTDDPVAALEKGDIDLALDLTPLEALRLGKERLRAPGPNRRVCFLAVNAASLADDPAPKLLGSAEFRAALSKAVPRERLLETYFRRPPAHWYSKARPALGPAYHRPLAGPYPPGSWAEDPAIAKQLLAQSDPGTADRAARGITGDDKVRAELTLLYPEGDPALEAALADLCATVSGPHLLLTPKAVEPHDLRRRLEEGKYELAYWHYDYPDDTFWPEPLLGPAGPVGKGNLFRYQSDAVRTELRRLRERRDPEQVRDAARRIHVLFAADLPFVPLWQLDPLVAVGPRLRKVPPFEPHTLFGEIERWGFQ
jgi:peptide/nickel transport system substrate-binding protein